MHQGSWPWPRKVWCWVPQARSTGPPTTQAGGQDDGSYTKLPQNIDNKYERCAPKDADNPSRIFLEIFISKSTAWKHFSDLGELVPGLELFSAN